MNFHKPDTWIVISSAKMCHIDISHSFQCSCINEHIFEFWQDSLESKDAACRDFLGRLNESLAVWGAKLPVDARWVYSLVLFFSLAKWVRLVWFCIISAV